MKIKYAFISKTGRRSNNEDFVKIIDKPEAQRRLGVVCDGMSGHALGDVASETVGNAVCDYWELMRIWLLRPEEFAVPLPINWMNVHLE